VILPLIISLLATLCAAVMAYGVHPGWAQQFSWGVGLIMLTRRLQWPLTGLSIVLCISLLALVISGKRRVFWLIALLPVLVMFVHRFMTAPMNRYSIVDEPAFVSADKATHLTDDDYVVGLSLSGQTFAYPYSVLYYNPVVVQSDRQKRLLLIWNPRANAATALEASRDLKARELDIVADPADSILLYNGRTGQFIVGLTGRLRNGAKPTNVEKDEPLPVAKVTWKQWRAEHPETQVMLPIGKLGPKSPMPMQTSVALVGKLAVKTDQIGSAPVNASDGSMPVLLFRDATTGRIKAFDRHVEKDLIPQFTPNNGKRKNSFMIDSDTSTGWSASGVAVDGEKQWKGHKLAPVPVQEDVALAPVQFWCHDLKLFNPSASSEASLEAHRANHAPATSSLEDRERTASHSQQGTSPRVPRARRPRPSASQHQSQHN
jgi:hypothetical protein